MLPILLFSMLTSCTKADTSPSLITDFISFDSVPISHVLQPMINEISGIAESEKNSGYIWGHEDSGSPAQLYLIGKDGKVLKKIAIKGAMNRDWEDICLVNGHLYIGDIGDNNSIHGTYYFYKIPEPVSSIDTVDVFEKISFQYPDGNHDAEAFLVDPVTEDIFIITKRDNPSKLYKLSHGYSTTEINKAVFVTNINTTGIVSAALSKDASSLLLKSYFTVSLYRKAKTSSISSFFNLKPTNVYYKLEPQGEAICFSFSDGGFYTLSEKGFGSNVLLYYYSLLK